MTFDLLKNKLWSFLFPRGLKARRPQATALPQTSSVASFEDCSLLSVSMAKWKIDEYDVEERFRQQIKQLCCDLWPIHTPTIECQRGGSFNQIAAITLPSRANKGQRNLILRVPHFPEDSRQERQVATLEFVRKRTTIPVPTIIARDAACNNALGKPYVLQLRIPGVDLLTVWNNLSHPQRCIVAAEVGRLIKTLLSIESPCAGTIEPSPNGPIVTPIRLMNTYGDYLEEADKVEADSSSFPPQTTSDFFESHFSTWKMTALKKYEGRVALQVQLYDDLIRVVREMDSLNLFHQDRNCLCHLDLYPRNIMVILPSRDTIEITGILDWDDAVFAPKCVACRPPSWTWGHNDISDFNNHLSRKLYELGVANDVSLTPRQQELKTILDEHAGPEYSRLAYDESSTLIRGLFALASGRLTLDFHEEVAERIVMEWDLLNPTMANRPKI